MTNESSSAQKRSRGKLSKSIVNIVIALGGAAGGLGGEALGFYEIGGDDDRNVEIERCEDPGDQVENNEDNRGPSDDGDD